MTRNEYEKLVKAVVEPLGWDPRGSDEEYALLEKAQKSWDKLKKLLKQHVEPTLTGR